MNLVEILLFVSLICVSQCGNEYLRENEDKVLFYQGFEVDMLELSS